MSTGKRMPASFLRAYYEALRLSVPGLGRTRAKTEPRRSAVIDMIHARARRQP
jgi:hypothetical protein